MTPVIDAVQRGRRLREAEEPVLVQGGERAATLRTGMGAVAGVPLSAPAEVPAMAGAVVAAAEAAAGSAGQVGEEQGVAAAAGAAAAAAARDSFLRPLRQPDNQTLRLSGYVPQRSGGSLTYISSSGG